MTVMLLILTKIQIKEFFFRKKSLTKLWGILGKNKKSSHSMHIGMYLVFQTLSHIDNDVDFQNTRVPIRRKL